MIYRKPMKGEYMYYTGKGFDELIEVTAVQDNGLMHFANVLGRLDCIIFEHKDGYNPNLKFKEDK